MKNDIDFNSLITDITNMKLETAFQLIKLIEDECPEVHIQVVTKADISQQKRKLATQAEVLGAIAYLRSNYDCNLTYWENIENAIGE